MRPLHRHARRRRRRFPAAAALVVAVLAATALVWQGTWAAFSSTSTNGADGWTTATVVLGDDDAGNALFVLANLVPGSTGQQCVQIQYSGTVPAAVKLYASTVSGALAPYLTITVEEGSGGSFGSCGSFAVTASDYTGSLAGFGSSKTAFTTGVSSWAPSSAASRVFRFSYTVQFTTPDAAAGTSASAAFVWEAQST